jgi:hypothetical protein
MVLPAEVLLIAHVLPGVSGPMPPHHCLHLAPLLVLLPLARCEVLQPLPLLPHPPPEVLVLLYDAVVQLPRVGAPVALVELQLLRRGIPPGE